MPFILVLLLSFCASFGLMAQADDVSVIYDRLYASVLVGPVATKANWTAWKGSFNPTTGRFNDLNYADAGSGGGAASWMTHTNRLESLARSYQTKSSFAYKNPDVLALLISIYDGRIALTSTPASNYWQLLIAESGALGRSLILLKAELGLARIRKAQSTMSLDPMSFNTGANLADVCKNRMYYAIAAGNVNITYPMAKITQDLQGIVIEANDQDSITADGTIESDQSLFQHGPQFYNGGYGNTLVGDVVYLADTLKGTAFAVAEAKLLFLANVMLNGNQWLIRGNRWSWMAVGRTLTRGGEQSASSTLATMLINLLPAASAGTSSPRAQLAVMRDRLQAYSWGTFYNTPNGDPKTMPDHPSGSHTFWRGDCQAVSRTGWSFTLRAASNRTLPHELVNGETILGYYLGTSDTGWFRRGDEYQDIWPVWDWARIPGSTNPYLPTATAAQRLVLRNMLYDSLKTKTYGWGAALSKRPVTFAGGVSDGIAAAYGIDYGRFVSDGQHPYADLNRYQAQQRKSWLSFDNEVVCLAAGITSSAPQTIVTSINQCLVTGPVTVQTGGVRSTPANGQHLLTGASWVHHDGIGYVVLGATGRIIEEHGSKTGDQNWIDDTAATAAPRPVQKNVFSLWLDHGVNPTNAGYQYVVVPDITADALDAYAKALPIRVLANTTTCQAARRDASKLSEAVFFAPGQITLHDQVTLTAQDPCVALVSEASGKVHLAVADPTHLLTTVRLVLGGVHLQGPGAVWNAANGTTISIPLPNNLGRTLAGSTVALDFTVASNVVVIPVLNPMPNLVVPEGGSSVVEVTLSAQPPAPTVVSITKLAGGDPDLNTASTTLTFTPTNWNLAQAVPITAAVDVDLLNGSAQFQFATDGGSAVITATEQDRDVLTIVPSTKALTVTESSSSTFALKLSNQPNANVVIAVAKQVGGDPDLTIPPTTLTFTPANWNIPQSVTVSAAKDADAVNGSATFTCTATGLPVVSILATEQDTDTQGILVGTSSVEVVETSTTQVPVRLAAQPIADVVVTVAKLAGGDVDLSVSPASMTFTTANWNIPQNLTFAAAKDADAINGTASFTLAASGLPTITVAVTEQDNDVLAPVVSAAAIQVPEGSAIPLQVQLSAQPPGDTTVTVVKVAGGDVDLTASTSALTFTPANWNIAQTLTIAAAVDGDATNGSAQFILATNGQSKLVTATEIDRSLLAPVIVPATAISVPEGGSATVQVKLSAQPSGPTSVIVAKVAGGDVDLNTTTTTVDFTTTNWNVAQTVSITAAEDADASNGSAQFTFSTAGQTQTITATEQDNDILAPVFIPGTAVTVPEGGTATVHLKLSAQPADTVVVAIAKVAGGDPDLTTDTTAVTFTSATWDQPQPITFSAAQDADTINGSASFTATLGDQVATLAVVEQDSGAAGIVLTPSGTVTVAENDARPVLVQLSQPPGTPVVVTIAKMADADPDLTVDTTTLTFTPDTWDQPQTVTFSAAPDPDAHNGTAAFTFTLGAQVETLVVTENDQDQQAIAVEAQVTDPTSVGLAQPVTIRAGDAATIAIHLLAAPVAAVTIAVSADGATVDSTTLTFTPDTWDQPQTVIITPNAGVTRATVTASATGWRSGALEVSVVSDSTVAVNPPTAIPDNGSSGGCGLGSGLALVLGMVGIGLCIRSAGRA
jgi:Polysaccharide lyase family 8, super-sandwich domain/Polysaccharide lyase family 8, N terminal alpha-helical domain/Polysaccharide lyase family 8, C-terminal beta-sandwich domain